MARRNQLPCQLLLCSRPRLFQIACVGDHFFRNILLGPVGAHSFIFPSGTKMWRVYLIHYVHIETVPDLQPSLSSPLEVETVQLCTHAKQIRRCIRF